MIPGTHLIIAKIIYEYIFKSTNFKLDYSSFAYGNIRPDIDKRYIKLQHTYEQSINNIISYSYKLMKAKISVKDFSEGLGVICHFICDYFCLQHSVSYWKKNKLEHGLYELELHTKLIKLIGNRTLNIRYNCKKEENIETLIMKLRKSYNNEPVSIMRDITYSIISGIEVSRLVIYSSKIYEEQLKLLKKK